MMMGMRTFGDGAALDEGGPPELVFSSGTTPAGGSVSTPGSGSVGGGGRAAEGGVADAELPGAAAVAGASSGTGCAASSATDGGDGGGGGAATAAAWGATAVGTSGGIAGGCGDSPPPGEERGASVGPTEGPCGAGGTATDVIVGDEGAPASVESWEGAKKEGKKQPDPPSHENTDVNPTAA
jgi:hypothetical protein